MNFAGKGKITAIWFLLCVIAFAVSEVHYYRNKPKLTPVSSIAHIELHGQDGKFVKDIRDPIVIEHAVAILNGDLQGWYEPVNGAPPAVGWAHFVRNDGYQFEISWGEDFLVRDHDYKKVGKASVVELTRILGSE